MVESNYYHQLFLITQDIKNYFLKSHHKVHHLIMVLVRHLLNIHYSHPLLKQIY